MISDGLDDPTLPGKTISTRATVAQLETALTTFEVLATNAREALDDGDACRVARLWRHVLGDNCEGPVFPMPPSCNDAGMRSVPASPIRAGLPSVPGGAQKFA